MREARQSCFIAFFGRHIPGQGEGMLGTAHQSLQVGERVHGSGE